MAVEIKNIGRRALDISATSAIPLFGRSADNLRDHRHVTSLLHRISAEPYGLRLMPTMSFSERGHLPGSTAYFVAGVDERGRAPAGFFPTLESFAGPGGDLERPAALTEERRPARRVNGRDQGKEAMGALQFARRRLASGEKAFYTVLLGINRAGTFPGRELKRFRGSARVESERAATESHWRSKMGGLRFRTGDPVFDNWIQWVQIQPELRRLFGCSFLPDFDYGRGGRGWRDLWQDCLALLLADPADVRADLVNNFGGVRADGSNATIIDRKKRSGRWLPEFVADRNNLTRTWMDHGVWPFLTTRLYIDQTGDWRILLEEAPYFRDAMIERGKKRDSRWPYARDPKKRALLTTPGGRVYQGTLLEHILIQTLIPFFNVGEHNIIRLEDADWNDGLDMAGERGESVAFTAFYEGNMASLAGLLENLRDRQGLAFVALAREVTALLDTRRGRVNYERPEARRRRLADYYRSISPGFSGRQARLSVDEVIADLRRKAGWIRDRLNRREWIRAGRDAWYNGYYDNKGRRVEGRVNGRVGMTLAGQVYPLMFGLTPRDRVGRVTAAVKAHLWDRRLGGVRLNTDFGGPQPDLGRAFAFAYGEKENGAVFSHMAVMYANALYRAGRPREGFRVLNGLFRMAADSARSRILPGLPEYFNNEGRGRYAYLTGSASWYVLTLLTRAFGVRGENGDLLIAPRLDPAQFDRRGEASVSLRFAGSLLNVLFRNPRRFPPGRAGVVSVRSRGANIPFSRRSPSEIVLPRGWVARRKTVNLIVSLGVSA